MKNQIVSLHLEIGQDTESSEFVEIPLNTKQNTQIEKAFKRNFKTKFGRRK